jgi:hypothetical protein
VEEGQESGRVARLDVTDQGGVEQLGLREVWVSDFAGDEAYQPVAVDFHLFSPPQGVEFRVAWPGTVDLALDRVEIWTLPDERWQFQSPLTWTLPLSAGIHTLAATAFDRAGNVSPATVVTTVLDLAPPVLLVTQTAITTSSIEVRWQATDDASGVAQVEIEERANGGEWLAHPQSPFAEEGELILWLDKAMLLPIRLRASDGAGRVSAWHERSLTPVAPLYLPMVANG